MRSLLATLLVGATLLAAGCGASSSGSSGSSSAPTTASLAPSDAGLWVTVDTDRGSTQWQALDAVLKQIPGAEGLIDDAFASIGSGDKKLDFATDIQPALGKEVVVVLPAGAASPVLLLKPGDEAKFESLIGTASTPPVTGKRDGWTVLAETQKALDAYDVAMAKGSLSDSDTFAAAMDGLPDEALARVFVDGKGLTGAVGSAAGAAAGVLQNLPVGSGSLVPSGSGTGKLLEQLGAIGLAVSAGDDGIHVDGTFKSGSGVQPKTFAHALLDQVPADALAALSFSGSDAVVKQAGDAIAAAGGTAKQLQRVLGVSIDDLTAIADGEGVVYLRRGLIIPEVTAVLEPKDPAQALATLDRVVAKVAGANGGKVTTTTQGGVTFKQVRVSILAVSWGRDGDRLVITTLPLGYQDFKADGDKLVDSARFETAAKAVGFGDTTAGFVYVDVKGLVPLVNTIAGAAGGSSSDPTFKKLIDALTALDTAAVNSTVENGRVQVHAVVRVSSS